MHNQALSYTPGQEQVYLNGILLVRGDDYTATNGTSITGLSALAANDFVQVNCYNNFSVATVPTTSLTGTIANNQLANSAITINGSPVSLGGSVTLAGDIESVTAGTGLTGGGTSGAVTLGLSTPVATTNGGTGLSSFATGDLLYASGSNTLANRSIGTSGQVLTVSGGVPTWSAPPAGKVLQVVTATTTTETTVTSSTFGDSGLSATITPSSASSRILILTNQVLRISRNSSNGKIGRIRLNRDSTPISSNTDGSEMLGIEVAVNSGQNIVLATGFSYTFLDSPNTTGAVTYKTQICTQVGSGAQDTTIAQFNQSRGSIVLLEIGA